MGRPVRRRRRHRPRRFARTWQAQGAGDGGWLRGGAMRGGYALFTVTSETGRPMILHARGHDMVYVNGEPRAGDRYDYGSTGWGRPCRSRS